MGRPGRRCRWHRRYRNLGPRGHAGTTECGRLAQQQPGPRLSKNKQTSLSSRRHIRRMADEDLYKIGAKTRPNTRRTRNNPTILVGNLPGESEVRVIVILSATCFLSYF